MPSSRLIQQIPFIVEIDKLKSILRQSSLVNRERRENSAEHSWHAAVAAMLLVRHADVPIDLLRVLKILLVHDIVEIDAGDTYCFDSPRVANKTMRERQAAGRLFGLLPAEQADELFELWEEFESGQTPEARFAAAVDRLLPLLHNYYTAGASWQAFGITSDRELERNQCLRDVSTPLWDLARSLIEDAVVQGYLAPAKAPAPEL